MAVRAALPVLAALALLIGVSAPREAQADGSQLCRSVTLIALAPFDVLLSPIITAKDIHYGVTEIDDEPIIKVISVIPGYVYLNTIQVGGAVFRVMSGAFEFFPGIMTLFREGSSSPLYRSQDETWQLYSTDIGPCPIRFGSSYNTINEG